ncbi:GTP 3',8-cyclase MoaA [Luteococcus peritonei]|uniref:GTP 3',8-cyclase n=1 Tax=Luteococcus peritonei TaxID=88874 RepID=A0ABW4RRL4_9ACTN
MPALVDRFGRVATDLRLSVTDVCNLRCSYCLPATDVHWLPRSTILAADELARLAHIGISRLGITKIRLTGGEPLTRPDLEQVVAAIAGPHPQVELALTTNGIGLAERAPALAEAGIQRVNISLDTAHAETYRTMTRREGHERVLDGIRAAAAAGLGPIKVNTVLLKGLNDHEVVDLVEMCAALGTELRFIEQMPIGATRDWAAENLITAADIRAQIEQRYRLVPRADRGASPAQRWEVMDGEQRLTTVGIIASVTEPFCGACDRTRISADGQLRSCLFSQGETDLRTPMREGADDEQLAQLWLDAMWAKPRAHGSDAGGFGPAGFEGGFTQPERPMNAIGG